MDSGKLSGKLIFPYAEPVIYCSGQLSGMSFKELNIMSEPAAGIIFTNGNLEKMSFDFKADQHFSNGTLNINYDDLDFTVQGKPQGDTTGIISRTITAIASVFVKKDSQTDSKVVLKGSICQERREDRFIFNYLWKSIFSGIRSAMVKSFGPDGDGRKEKLPC